MRPAAGQLLHHKTGAPVGISARLVGDGSQLVLQVNAGKQRTLLGTHTVPIKDAFERAVDKLLEFRGQSGDLATRSILCESFPAFMGAYDLREVPVQATALVKGNAVISIRAC